MSATATQFTSFSQNERFSAKLLQFQIKKLSPQEKRIFYFLFEDLAMKEIAARLGISPKTIDTYAVRIYHKFEVNGRIGLILQTLAETKGENPLAYMKRLCYDVPTQ